MSKSNVRILVVDDVPDNVKVVLSILKEESYSLSFAFSGEEALEVAASQVFDLILLDIMMPGKNGFEVCRELKNGGDNQDTPVIFLSARSDIESIAEGFQVGGVDYIVKPFHPDEVVARVNTHVSLAIANRKLNNRYQRQITRAKLVKKRLLDEIEENQREMIYILMEMMEMTSDETGQHIRRVAESAQLLARYTDILTEEDELILFHAAPMHDIGKILIPNEILHKPGKLTADEFELMKIHTTRAAEVFPKTKRRLISAANIIALQHHEKWDGSGYPQGLKGEQIHIYGRIVALADVFDALTHKRRYKDAWSIDDAVNYLRDNRGSHFDPLLVDVMLEHIDEFVAIINADHG